MAQIDNGKCRFSRTVVEPGTSYQVTEDLVYDDSSGGAGFGNVITDTITGSSMTPRVTTVDWGTTGQFPVTIRDPASNALGSSGYSLVRGYNYDLGTKTSEVTQTLDGVTNNAPPMQWHPDAFGRIDTITRPDSTSTSITYNACAAVAGGCQNGDPASGATGINKMVTIATQNDTSGTAIRDDWTYMDQFDRTIVTKSKTLIGTYSRVGTQFDVFGNVAQRTEPCDAASCTAYWTVNHYDALNRLTSQQRPNWTQAATVLYQSRTTVYTDPQSKATTRVSTVVGQMGRSEDHNGYWQDFAYDAFGSLVNVQDNGSPINTTPNVLYQASYVYGLGALQTDATDMDLDVSTASGQHRHYVYDALGELTSLSDARGSTTTFGTYDPLGRPTTRTEATTSGTDLSTTWTWGNAVASHNIGQLASVTAVGPQSYSESRTYDLKARLSTLTMLGSNFDFAYNALGSVDTLTYPVTTNNCRVALQYGYQNGIPKTITDVSAASSCILTGTVYWTANSQNPRGEITQETLGNNVVTTRAFDPVTGWPSSITAGAGGGSVLQNQSYLYDVLGNVIQRQDGNAGKTESICYDNLYRLDHTTASGLCSASAKLQMVYDAMGNIQKRNDVAANAQWTYSTTHKHQVLQAGDTSHTYTYDNDGNSITRNGSGISWTSYNMPLTINAPGESSTFSYGQSHQKWQQQYTGPSGSETTTYLGNLIEKVVIGTTTDWRHYIYAGGEQVAVYSRTSALVNTVRYTLEDHQGSPSAILASTANPATPIVKESFEPYGTRRNPATWSGAPAPGDLTTINGITRVGYTGQTMLGNMGLIHMNGRVEDSVTGRFLSADPYVTEPGNTQNFNRYGYVYNNPLSYVDPSGFSKHGISAAACDILFGHNNNPDALRQCLQNAPDLENIDITAPRPSPPDIPDLTNPGNTTTQRPPGGGGSESPLEEVVVTARPCQSGGSGRDANVFVSAFGNNVQITLPVIFSGPGDNPWAEAQYVQAIQSAWSGQFGQYSVNTTVTSGIGWPAGNSTSIEIGPRTNDREGYNATTLTMNLNSLNTGNNQRMWIYSTQGAVHEVGHVLGLYRGAEGYGSGGPLSGFSGDIMGEVDMYRGAVTVTDMQNVIANNSCYSL